MLELFCRVNPCDVGVGVIQCGGNRCPFFGRSELLAALSWGFFMGGGGLVWLTCRLTEGSRRFSLSADALLIVIVGKTFFLCFIGGLMFCFVLVGVWFFVVVMVVVFWMGGGISRLQFLFLYFCFCF